MSFFLAWGLRDGFSQLCSDSSYSACRFEWDWAKAQEVAETGVEVDPNSGIAWACYAYAQGLLGEGERSNTLAGSRISDHRQATGLRLWAFGHSSIPFETTLGSSRS